MSYIPTKPKSTGASGKYDTHTRSTQTSSYSQIQAATGGGGNYELKEGDKTIQVTVDPGSSYPAVVEARKQALEQQASSGGALTEKQKNELAGAQVKQIITVYIDKAAVERYNQMAAEQGIGNAQLYFEKVLGAKKDQSNLPPMQEGFYIPEAPRTPNRSETTSVNQGFDTSKLTVGTPEKKYGGEMHSADFQAKTERTPGGQLAFDITEGYANLNIEANKQGNELLLLPMLPIKFTVGAIEGGMDLIKSGIEIYKAAPKGKEALNIIKDVEFASNVETGILQGMVDFTGEIGSAVLIGNIQELSELGGKAYAQTKIIHASGLSAKTVLKGAFVDFGKEIKFIQATEMAPVDTSYEFNINNYGLEGRQGMIIPPEYQGIYGARGQEYEGTSYLKAAELQSQLIPKKVSGIQEGTPETYKPSTLLELAKKEPALAKELAKENGQMVFNPEQIPRLRDLTPEERLGIAKKQANIIGEIQKTLPGTKPTGQEIFMLKNNKVFAKLEGKELEIKNTPIFSLDPLTASAISIYQERETLTIGIKDLMNKFTRKSEIILNNEILGRTKEGYLPGLIIGETQDLNLGINSPIITRAFMPNIHKQKGGTGSASISITEQSQKQDIEIIQIQEQGQLSRQHQGQRQGQVQIQIQEQAQTQTQIQIQQQELTQIQIPTLKINNPKQTTKPPLEFSKSKKEESKKGVFEIQVRRRGRFQTIGTAEQPREAFAQGLARVRAGAGASFRIIDLLKNQVYQGEETPSFDIGPSKREPGVYIQKRNKRISSFGEKAEITYKGIASNRGRNKKMKL